VSIFIQSPSAFLLFCDCVPFDFVMIHKQHRSDMSCKYFPAMMTTFVNHSEWWMILNICFRNDCEV